MSSDATEPPLDQLFNQLKDSILSKKPVLKEILQKKGSKKLYDYAKEYIDINLVPTIHQRQDEFLFTFKKEVTKLLGARIATGATEQLRKYYYVSTADHHGPICHPFFLSSNLIAAAPSYFEKEDPVLNNVIVLACGNVSLDNSSYPRGLLFNTFNDGKLELHKLPFFPASTRQCPVYRYPAYKKDDIDRVKNTLAGKVKDKHLAENQAAKVTHILDEIYLKPEALDSEYFSEQVTKTNYELWKKFFDSDGYGAPNLIYLELESFVNQLLLDYHMEGDSTIYHMLFDPAYDPLVKAYFDGIDGGFTLESKKGTYLFWGLPKESKYRMQMWKQGDELVSNDGAFKVKLTPKELGKKLESKELIPSTMMSYTLLAFYYGLKLLGGFSQVNYLTFMKNAYIKMQTDRGNYKSIEVSARSQTKELCGDITLAFLGLPDGSLTPATGLDMILYGNSKTWPQFVEMSRHMTIEEAIMPLLPDFYPIVYPEGNPERKAELLKITSRDIIGLLHLDDKIKPCARIK
ncbi:MAG: hypothetical protein UV80_C0006G0020 [Candidatus Peregrinibacteria bacterium GW2011_GWF2_43_17]|nr:MAG: hypothetical protein UV80_C0006G0020 [Candidatus Peregrinibacteria bacterium GW2011_GWF2_43_17]HAU40388.1 hypothetical protein [Candidatus Peregrinibacteria bacterium]